ncbi:MAG: glycosyltransferase family 2 protein [Candidatus Caldatribacterium sp.]|nr:glycosyltransferase family 2 protein [Candidatus Caldatribacterium sp.]
MHPFLALSEQWVDDSLEPLRVLALLLYCFWVYETIVALRGFQSPRPLPRARRFRKFAVLIPAHNEEKVLGPLLESLKRQEYPREFFDVYVACDACTDRTKEVALAHGAFVLERNDPKRPGKTHDAIALFDADNLVHPQFLSRMNDYLEAHEDAEVIQGYLETKNPDHSWLTRMYALAYWYANRFWQLARANWGLSATLGGTGLVIRTSCISRLGWNLKSLTEDLEFSVQVVLAGGKVHWNEWAITYDEKPTCYASSHRQRTRWMQGHSFILWRYGWKLLLKFLLSGHLQYLDYLLYLFTPLSIVLTTVSVAFEALRRGVCGNTSSLLYLYLWIPLALVQSAYQVVLGPSLKEGRFTLRYLPYFALYTVYGLSWIPIVFSGVLLSWNQRRWVKTEHSCAISIKEILGESAASK